MTARDFEVIERGLGIRLPDSYRRKLDPFPIPSLSANRDTELWDDAEALVRYNRQLRENSRSWPEHLFVIGRNEGDSALRAIDLRAPEVAPVWWIDHQNPAAAGSGQTHPTFEGWVDQYAGTLRRELAQEGCDPDGSPAHYATWSARAGRRERRILLYIVAFGFAAIMIYAVVRRYM
jgi:hypothetical protein